jgi:acyl carrier protein
MDSDIDAKADHAPQDQIATQIRAMISKLLQVEPTAIDPEQLLTASGMTSIELIDLITRIEARYGIEFPAAAAKNLTARQVIDVVTRLIGEQP